MQRTTFSIPQNLKEKVEEVSKDSGRSESEIMRSAIADKMIEYEK